MNWTDAAWLVACVAVAFLPAVVGSASVSRVTRDPSGWYVRYRPSWTPPSWVFPVVWTCLYAGIGWTLFTILRRPRTGSVDLLAATVLLVNLALNAAWSPLFFGAGALGAALAICIALLVSALWVAARLRSVPMFLYAAWLAFASALNVAFLIRKRSA